MNVKMGVFGKFGSVLFTVAGGVQTRLKKGGLKCLQEASKMEIIIAKVQKFAFFAKKSLRVFPKVEIQSSILKSPQKWAIF